MSGTPPPSQQLKPSDSPISSEPDDKTQTLISSAERLSQGRASDSDSGGPLPFSLRWGEVSGSETESAAAAAPPPEARPDWNELIREISWTTADDEEFVPKYEDVLEIRADGTRTIQRTYLDKEGKPVPATGGAGKRPAEAPAGPAAKRKKTETPLTLEDIKRTPAQKSEAETIILNTLKPGVEGIEAADKAVTDIVTHFYDKQDRGLFETQPPDAQCEGVFGKHEVQSEICWLCGFAQVAYAGDGKPYDPNEGGDPLDTGTITNEGGLENSVCEHKLPVKVAHFFRLMYRKLDMTYGQVDEAQYERIKKLYGTAHIICNIIKDNDRFLKSTLGVKTFGSFTENVPVIQNCMKSLLNVVRKRASTTPVISEILPGSRFYFWGTLLMKQTGDGKTYYRNMLMYRIHKMERFVGSKNPYRSGAIPKIPVGSTGIPFTGQFTYPSVGSVKKWLDMQYTNIVGGINELRLLLDSERDTLYAEGVQVINRKPFRENAEWWALVKQYVPSHPAEAEDFKHGLRLPFDRSLIEKPTHKPIQRIWKEGDILPQSSNPVVGGRHRPRITIRRRSARTTKKNKKRVRKFIEVHV